MSIKIGVGEKTIAQLKPRITVIGVGGGGGNAVNNMISKNLEGVDFVVANTDAQALEKSPATNKIQIGLETTQGLGSGARPEIGRMSAEEAEKEIGEALEGANMVFITAGMGGGTGSGAAPVVARIAKQKGILTVGVVTKPFAFEGKKRQEIADAAVEEFTKEVDSIIIIPNQNLFRIADKNTTLSDAFVMADNVLYSGVRSITDLMMMPGLINLDFADVKSIMEDKGKAIMGTGEAEGEDRAIRAAEMALANPLLDDCSMHGAKGVLINITGSSDITLMEVDAAANRIKEEVDEDANIIFGSSFNESLEGKIRVSVVATGIGNSPRSTRTNPYAQPMMSKTVSYIDESYISPEEAIQPKEELVKEVEVENKSDEPQTIEPETDLEEKTGVLEEETSMFEDNFASVSEELEKTEPLNIDTMEMPEAHSLVNLAHDHDFDKFEDTDMLETSSAIDGMPKSSALFNSIINNDEEVHEKSDDLKDLLPEIEDSFAAKEPVVIAEDEPVLFNTLEHERTVERDPVDVVVSQPKPSTFLDRLLFNRNRKKEDETRVEPKADTYMKSTATDFSGDEVFDDDEKLNLDLPSFLRRS